ncbi:MAG: hypothetical protein ABIA59_05465, partial [Candidatus Latescibacterota bacterium]
LELYKEAIGLGLEAGEPLETIKYYKKASNRFAAETDMLRELAVALVKNSCDPVFGKYLLEQSIKEKNLPEGLRIARALDELNLADLRNRTRKKGETLSSALIGGHKFDSELTVNEICEALLNLALGHIREASRTFIEHLDANAIEVDTLVPLLLELETLYPKEGAVRYALGSCYLMQNDIALGVKKIALAVRLNPDLVDDIARRLEDTAGKDSMPHASLEMALMEAYTLQGNISKIASLAQSILDAEPQKAPHVLDLVTKSIDKGTSNWELEEFFLEASLRSKQTKRIRDCMEKTWHKNDKKRNYLDWLETHSKSGDLPADIQIFFGKLVLKEGRSDWAVNIFKRTAEAFPAERHTILYVLDRHPQSDPQIDEFRDELRSTEEESAGDGEIDIQCFERSEFSLSSYQEEQNESELNLENNNYESKVAGTSDPCGALPSADTSLEELADHDTQSEQEPHSLPQAQAAKTKSSAFAGPEPNSTKAPADIPRAGIPRPRAEARKGSSPDKLPADFDAAYRDYLAGTLDNNRILALIERALDLGKFTEAKAMLDFQPVTIGEEVKRVFSLAAYHLYGDRPLPALIALKSFHINSLNRSEKREYLSQLAACYRALKMFEAAHCAFIKLMNEEPSDTHAALMAKKNYEDYLAERCEKALILEKVGFLED